jgi:HSP20 family protein
LFGSWEPFGLLEDFLRGDPFREMMPVGDGMRQSVLPNFEVLDTDDGYVFRADLPGVAQNDIDISVTGNRLTISGKRDEEQVDKTGRYYIRERVYGNFSRSFTLPQGADLDHIQADCKDGVLTIRVRKQPELAARKIAINPGRTEHAPGGKQAAKA